MTKVRPLPRPLSRRQRIARDASLQQTVGAGEHPHDEDSPPASAGDQPGPVRTLIQRYSLVAYLVLAYAFSWSVHVPLALSACGALDVTLPAGLHVLGAYGPMLAALGVTGAIMGVPGLRDLLRRMLRWRVGIGWLLAAIFSPAVFFLASAVILRLWNGAWPAFGQFGHIPEFPKVGWLAAWIVWTLTFGLGEETGWRGFALPRLQRSRSGRSATAILGALWVLWHLPQFFYNYELSSFGVIAFTVSTMSGALVLTWLYNSTGGSVLVTMLWHGAFNTAVAGAQGAMAALVSGFVILAALVIAQRTGPEISTRARLAPTSRNRPGSGRCGGGHEPLPHARGKTSHPMGSCVLRTCNTLFPSDDSPAILP